ncbi:C3HC zinc finger-like-domain-containing protein [Cytidiella melzeri]|nr:C3HC zinc finger-like-domain-containing protein [Cytidiella melzeri]
MEPSSTLALSLGPLSSAVPASESASMSPERTLKRKFEDAIHVLDDAIRPAETIQPSTKRLRPSGPSHSIYATLAKYGIRKDRKPPAQESRLQSLSRNAPHLVAILSRSATRARKANPFKSAAPPTAMVRSGAAASEYRPSSTTSFLARLATYKLTTYANKPPAIDAVAAAKCGWVNDGKDRLVCGLCTMSWVLAGTHGMNRDAANALVEKQRIQLVDMHKDGCPWKTRQCDASIYRVPLQTPAAMVKDLKAEAIKLDSAIKEVQIRHPLTAAQAQTLEGIISSVKLRAPNVTTDDEPEEQLLSADSISASPFAIAPFLVAEPCGVAVIAALFGWSLILPVTSEERPRKSISRATSVTPSTPRPTASPRSLSRGSTPAPPMTPRVSFNRHTPSTSISSMAPPAANTTLLHCPLCQRRIGLWAFLPPSLKDTEPSESSSASKKDAAPRRQLDVLKEHRSYCPYVVRSTVVPSLPVQSSSTNTLTSNSNSSLAQLTSQPGELEGWRAVLAVVLRYGATQKQRLGYSRGVERSPMDSGGETLEPVLEDDPVAAMVEGVKARGGKALLKYVKGLLG